MVALPLDDPAPRHPSHPRRPSATIIEMNLPTSQSQYSRISPSSPNHHRSPAKPRPPMQPSTPSHREASATLAQHPCEAGESPSTGNYVLPRTRTAASDPNAPNTESRASPAPSDEATGLLSGIGAAKWHRGPLFTAALRLGVLFTLFSALVLGTFWFGLPALDGDDRALLKLPRSFADLQTLNTLFQKYKGLYPGRILLCGVVAYLYVQAFSLPGSMYISILFGAAYGMVAGLFLSCFCDATGSILCYTLSAILGPPLLQLPYYRQHVDRWRAKIMGDPSSGAVGLDGVTAVLIVLRIMPLPPHWMANFVAPHLGISALLFWATCFVGIAPVSVIHVTIGSSLDQMSSADDLQILSVRNVLGLAAVVVAVLIPVGLKRVFRKDFSDLGEEALEGRVDAQDGSTLPLAHSSPVPIEFDEHGLPTKYQSVDSGVNLAGPSAGDPNLDLDLIDLSEEEGEEGQEGNTSQGGPGGESTSADARVAVSHHGPRSPSHSRASGKRRAAAPEIIVALSEGNPAPRPVANNTPGQPREKHLLPVYTYGTIQRPAPEQIELQVEDADADDGTAAAGGKRGFWRFGRGRIQI